MLIAFLATITCRLCSHDEHHLACLTNVSVAALRFRKTLD